MPNLNEYQPNDFYDLRPGPSTPINTSRTKDMWFDPSPRQKMRTQEQHYPKTMPLSRDRDFNIRALDTFSGNRLRLQTNQMLKRKRPRMSTEQLKVSRGDMSGHQGVSK